MIKAFVHIVRKLDIHDQIIDENYEKQRKSILICVKFFYLVVVDFSFTCTKYPPKEFPKFLSMQLQVLKDNCKTT